MASQSENTSSASASGSITLVLGGARSGKSAYAESLIEAHEGDLTYLATGQAWDGEMRTRIDDHKERRGDRWQTVEAPRDLAAALDQYGQKKSPILLDCLTLWVTNLMMEEGTDFEVEFDALIASLQKCTCPVVIVSNEVGMGIVPDNKMAREFRDHAGSLHQRVAAISNTAVLVVAGLPLTLKG